MNVLLIASDVNLIGGIEKYNRDFIYALEQAGVTPVLIERKKGGFFAKISFVFRVFFEFLRSRPDFIFCAHLNFSPLCLTLKYLFKVKYSIALYGIEIPGLRSGLKRKSGLAADVLITISDYSKSLILEHLPSCESRIYMLPSSVDGTIFDIRPKRKDLEELHKLSGRPVVLSLSRLASDEYKGQDRVLRAMPLVLKEVPNAMYLVVGGGNDSRVDSFLSENPWLRENVIFTGAISNDLRVDYYNLPDVYVLPTKYDGFCIVFIESLACGVPVIAADGFGCRAGLFDGELGLLVPPDDIPEIAKAIVKVLKRTAPSHLYDRENLRRKTLSIYGVGRWNERVKALVSHISVGDISSVSKNKI